MLCCSLKSVTRYTIQLGLIKYVSCYNQFESTLSILQNITRYHEFAVAGQTSRAVKCITSFRISAMFETIRDPRATR